ncbi:MBL fold metallo-hydrolase [Amycolatopsis sp. H20-H5]|uniref:MBL fold metallo-hydrolase n=1 Tax=Amycolatopsis sp. H20-H5 TaxID=3046309 RepID=UPI002DBEB299|nr:MBL fold metallo-hydrolase [Amycolatopsis sp. H20-H5]MEC3975878.1 MBL fold metallo-hydrolase [Amycolatopsis sp. H20-H5]
MTALAAEPVIRRVVVGPLQTNCWIVHAAGERHALLLDPGDDAPAILAAAKDLEVVAVLLTHTHFDHVLAVPHIRDACDAPVLGHRDEVRVWEGEVAELARTGHWDAGTATADLLAAGHRLAPQVTDVLWNGHFDDTVSDQQIVTVGSLSVQVLHTPGHSPGSISLHVGSHLFTGDTLFPGGPGLTGPQWPLTSFPAIMTSVRRLLALPSDTVIHPGHGPDTTVATERPSVEQWQRRGW